MKAVILAAGKGERMGQLTKNKPKCMVEFLGRTLLARQIGLFNSIGVSEIIVVTGYMAEMVNSSGCVKIKNEHYDSTNMVESLFCARDKWLDEVIVSYGDIIYEKRILEEIIAAKGDINVAVDLNGLYFFKERFGNEFNEKIESLVMDKTGRILDIGEASPHISRIQGQYIGLMKFTQRGLEILSDTYDEDKRTSKNFQNGFMTDMLQRIIDKGHKVSAVKIRSGWLEFDTVGDYEKYHHLHSSGDLIKYYDPDA